MAKTFQAEAYFTNASATQKSNADILDEPQTFVYAVIMTYEKRDGRSDCVAIRDSRIATPANKYRNMAYWLRKDMRPVELAREAFVMAGLKPYDHAS